MKALSTIAGLLTVFVHLPIWYYLIYKILDMVGASELMWFLFWIYKIDAASLGLQAGVKSA